MIMLSPSVSWISFIYILLFCSCLKSVDGHSYGAGSCMGGGAAVGGWHYATLGGLRSPQSKDLSLDFPNITVTIGNVTMDTSGNGANKVFKANTIYIYKISSTSRNMRGIMMRVQAPSGTSANVTNGMIVHDRNTHISRVCSRDYTNQLAQGITHWNSLKKNVYTGFIKFVEPTNNVIFDITMVTVNSLFRSEYAYGTFKANFVA